MEQEPKPGAGHPRARKEPSASSLSSVASSHTSASNLASPPQRTPSQSNLLSMASPHRQSFAENLRNMPPSPRSQRHPSFTGVPPANVQDLLSLPPTNKMADPRFAGRDWRAIRLGELASLSDVKWVTMDTCVEEATMALVKDNSSNVVLVRNDDDESSEAAVSTFDYNDLNAYLLVVVGLAQPDEENVTLYDDIATKGREGVPIPLRDIQSLCRKQPLVTLLATETLDKAIEVLGGGIHRVIVSDSSGSIIGILSQLKLIEFFWNEGVHFPSIERLYPSQLRDLGIDSKQVLAVNSDSALAEALTLMYNEGLTSVAVVDNGSNVVGNISTVDVRLLTNAASAPLLQGSCMHFISVILNERGVEKGRDPFPVFHVNPYSSLAHTVAKLVATCSHRMWVVDPSSPSPPKAPSPAPPPPVAVPGSNSAPHSPTPGATFGSISSSALPGAHLSGRLSGVVSLTDILNLFAKSSGLNPPDPSEQRARRRRSSSSSVRPSLDSGRPSIDSRW